MCQSKKLTAHYEQLPGIGQKRCLMLILVLIQCLVGRPLYSELFSLQEAELQGVMSDLQSQLEAEKQHSELAKVSEMQRKVRPSLTANAAFLHRWKFLS